ncbi:MAG TPA: hypothetical protein PKX00_03375 [Opitutaceae bacterium]|nr:hypothetical protein [Opitutaceae bacterium]
MSPESEQALATLHRMARGHAGASSGERAAFGLLQNLETAAQVDMADCFVRLDSTGKRAVLQLLLDLASGKTGLSELR